MSFKQGLINLPIAVDISILSGTRVGDPVSSPAVFSPQPVYSLKLVQTSSSPVDEALEFTPVVPVSKVGLIMGFCVSMCGLSNHTFPSM